jgi:hypothetical protein
MNLNFEIKRDLMTAAVTEEERENVALLTKEQLETIEKNIETKLINFYWMFLRDGVERIEKN